MRALILSLLLAAAAIAQPTPPPSAIVKGTPPGGSGGACSASPQTGYLDNTGTLYTCQSSVWTSVSGGGFSSTPQWSIITSPAAAPGAPTVGTHGAAGSTTYGYKIAYHFPNGTTAAGSEALVTTGNAVLSATNYNTIAVPSCSGAGQTVDVYLTTGGGNTPDAGFLANVACGSTYNHQGADGDYSQIAPTANTTAGAYSTYNFGTITQGLFGNQAMPNPHNSPSAISMRQKVTQTDSIYFSETGASFETYADDVSLIDGTTVTGQQNVSSWLGTGAASIGAGFTGMANYAQIGDWLFTGALANGDKMSVGANGNMAVVNSSGGTVTSATGVSGGVDVPAGNVTNAYAMFSHNGRTNGTVANRYGLYIEGVTGASNNYAIKTGAGSVDFSNATNVRLPSDATATTQSAADNSTKVATTAYADAAVTAKATLSSPYLVNGGTSYGPMLTLTPPPASGWSWVTQGSSTVSTTAGGALLFSFKFNGADNARCYMRALPANSNYTAEIGILGRAHAIGMAISDGTKLIFVWDNGLATLTAFEWNSSTSVGSSYFADNHTWSLGAPLTWMRFVDDGTNRIFSICGDTDTCNVINTQTSHTFLTETQFGICYESNQGSDGNVKLVHVKSSTP